MMMYSTFFLTVTMVMLIILSHFFSGDRPKKSRPIKKEKSSFKHFAKFRGIGELKKTRVYRQLFYIKKKLSKKVYGRFKSNLEIKLQRAGNPHDMNVTDFRVLQLVISMIFMALAMTIGFFMEINIFKTLFLGMMALILGVLLANYYLIAKIKGRQKKGLQELADFIDLLTINLEAGMGFDLALNKLTSKRPGVVSDEFHRCIEEIKLGKMRRVALKNITERLYIEDLNTLINSVVQADKLGISIVKVLRVESVEIRKKRKQRAEEQAMKAPIKMLFPLILFIFPSIFIVLLGPAVIQLIKAMGGGN